MNAFLPKFFDVTVSWAMRHQWPPGQCYHAQPIERHSLWLFQSGEAKVLMGGRDWHIKQGMAFLCPPHVERQIVTPHGAQWLSVSFKATLFGNVDLLQLMWPPVAWKPEEYFEPLEHAMSSLVREWAGTSFSSPVTPDTVDKYVVDRYTLGAASDATALLLCDAYARAITGLCWRMLGKIDLEQAADQGLPSWLSLALQDLRANPNISIEQLARDLDISPTQLRRQFQIWLGASPREYLNRQRLEDARQLLETTDLSVSEISHHIGFHSAPHFNTLFKRVFRIPPAQFRQMSRFNGGKSAL